MLTNRSEELSLALRSTEATHLASQLVRQKYPNRAAYTGESYWEYWDSV